VSSVRVSALSETIPYMATLFALTHFVSAHITLDMREVTLVIARFAKTKE
jgi:hypothetical protein